jgi:hypothetical protein
VLDSAYANLDESLRKVLTVGRPIEQVAPETAAGPRANPDSRPDCSASATASSAYVSATLINSTIVRLPASRCDRIPFSPQVLVPRYRPSPSGFDLAREREPPC